MVNLATYVGNTQAGLLGAVIATLAVVMPFFVIILLVMAALKTALKNQHMQAVLRGLKPSISGIILATGAYMILHNCLGTVSSLKADWIIIGMTAVLASVYFGSRKVLKNGISPIALIGISAILGMTVFGLK